jgi:ADP-ribosylation factor-like protein 5B
VFAVRAFAAALQRQHQFIWSPLDSKIMGGMVSSLWQRLFGGQKEYKICIVGLDNAGKTVRLHICCITFGFVVLISDWSQTCLYQMNMGEVVATKPTIGSNVEEVNYQGLKLVCWDLGGQESLRATWSTYFVGTDAVMMVVDSSDRERIGIVKEELWRILSHKVLFFRSIMRNNFIVDSSRWFFRHCCLQELQKAAVLVFANKQDVENKMTSAEIAKELNLIALKDINITWHIQTCCALTGDGLFEVCHFPVSTSNFVLY